jgi:hypothetical protein
MDLQKIRVRQDLQRMVLNYFVIKDITEDQSARICDYIDRIIGGGEFPQPGRQARGGAVIPFPTAYTGQQNNTATPERVREEREEREEREAGARKAREALAEIYAPYGEPLPEGVEDFRQALQRDGLILIRYEKRTSKEGSFFNVLWARSVIPRLTAWSGNIREEDIPHALPLDVEYSHYFHEETTLSHAVIVAPDNVLSGPLSDFTAYVQSLKKSGLKNNFDYSYHFAAEKRERYLQRNAELITLKLSPRIIGKLNERDIYGIKKLKKITVQELRGIKSIGEQTVSETLAILKAAGITLQEEKAECEENTDG